MSQIKLEMEESEVLRFQVNRNITNFYKSMLVMLEDIAEDHDNALCKLQEHLPTEYKKYVDLADYLTEEKFSNLRGKILSGGNDTIRQIEEQMKNFEIKIKGK